ncbi:MAG: two-component regulator propeller domain-containing protein, partial [Nitrososphaeraceae archaeon]
MLLEFKWCDLIKFSFIFSIVFFLICLQTLTFQDVFSTNNNKSFEFTLIDAPFNIQVLKNRLVNDILEDANGNLWIATSHGLVIIHPDGSWQLLSENDGLPSANISCVIQDREKNIWIGTYLGLAKLVTKTDIRFYIGENMLTSPTVNFLLPLKNDLFLASTETGLQFFNTTNKLFSPVGSPKNSIYTGFVQNSRPVLFFSNHNRFRKYDSVNKRVVDYILAGP